MHIKQAIPTDYPHLVDFYQEQFPVHNVFQNNPEQVLNYLMTQGLKYGVYLAEDKGTIKGAIVIVNKLSTPNNSHKVWKFRHFTFTDNKTGEELLTFAQGKIKEQSKTAKIELTVADSEKEVQFYRKQGYVLEATLKNHYRWGESCFIFSKSIPEHGKE